jgi:hypothetical protein
VPSTATPSIQAETAVVIDKVLVVEATLIYIAPVTALWLE